MTSRGAKSGEPRRAYLTYTTTAGALHRRRHRRWIADDAGLGAQRRGRSARDHRGRQPDGRGDGSLGGSRRARSARTGTVEALPNFAEYPEKSGRVIPVIRIDARRGLANAPGASRRPVARWHHRPMRPRPTRRSSRTRPACSTSGTATRSTGSVRQSRRQAGGRAPRRAGQRAVRGRRRWFDPAALSARPVRSAGLRPEHAACRRLVDEPGGEHDPPPGRRHRTAPRASRHRALARLGRVVGRDARPRVRGALPGASDGDDPALDHDDAPRPTSTGSPTKPDGTSPRSGSGSGPASPRTNGTVTSSRPTTGC